MRYYILTASIISILISCGENPVSLPVAASETWRITDAANAQNYGTITLSKLADSSVVASGNFYYSFFGYQITCSGTSGAATVANTAVTINLQGLASYPPDSTGNAESSAFSMQMSGTFKSGSANGNWQIDFTDTLWQGWIDPGQFTGTLQNGSGVTAN